jgi:hypothetical protein
MFHGPSGFKGGSGLFPLKFAVGSGVAPVSVVFAVRKGGLAYTSIKTLTSCCVMFDLRSCKVVELGERCSNACSSVRSRFL